MLAAFFHQGRGNMLIRPLVVKLEPGANTQESIFEIPAKAAVPAGGP